DYEVAVFENLFPTLSRHPGDAPASMVATRPGVGAAEVVVFTQDSQASLGRLTVEHIALILEVWGDRTRELGGRAEIAYVMPFENRGAAVGVTLHHPHGQIYAFPFVPPIAAREQALALEHHLANGRTLLGDHIAGELADGRRMLYSS